jgi:hypothetical protein
MNNQITTRRQKMNKLTLAEDFEIWWNMPKYRKREILAKEFGNQKIVYKNASNRGWPGEERDVDYWVELENGFAVGMRHGRSESGMRRAKYADFPVVKMPS